MVHEDWRSYAHCGDHPRKWISMAYSPENYMSKKNKISKPKRSPGPKPDVLKLKGRWMDAVKKSLRWFLLLEGFLVLKLIGCCMDEIKKSLKNKTTPEGWPK